MLLSSTYAGATMNFAEEVKPCILTRNGDHSSAIVNLVRLVVQRRGAHRLYVLRGENSDSGATVKPPKALMGFSSFIVDFSALYDILVDCRLHKVGTWAQVFLGTEA